MFPHRFFGRKDGQVQLRGFRIELGEIEAVLVAAPGVQTAAVVLQDAETPNAALVAFVAPAEAEESAVIAACAAKLPRYMLPSAVVRLEQLPRLPNGKVSVFYLWGMKSVMGDGQHLRLLACIRKQAMALHSCSCSTLDAALKQTGPVLVVL